MRLGLSASKGRLHILKSMAGVTNWRPAVHAALEAGQMQTLLWLQESEYINIDGNEISYAAQSGKLDVVLWLQSEFEYKWNFDRAMCVAVEIGSLELIKYFRNIGVKLDSDLYSLAAKYGHFEVLKWLHENECRFDEDVTKKAAIYGNLSILQWLIEVKCPFAPVDLEEGAIKGGNLDLIKWLHANLNIEWRSALYCKEAIVCCDWDILEWLLDHNCKTTDLVLMKALEQGASLNILQRLFNEPTPSLEKICKTAGAYGRLEFMIWLANKNLMNTWNYAYHGAAEQNQFDYMKKIYSNYCVCTEQVKNCTSFTPVYNWLKKQECIDIKQSF